MTRRTRPLGKSTDYDYYFRGWLKSRTDGAGRITQYQYDVLERLKEINYPGNTNVTMNYDAVGHVTSLSNNNSSSTFTCDILGRLTNTTVRLNVPGMTNVQYRLEYQYDAAGNVTNRTLRGLSGFSHVITARFGYDSMTRLTSITDTFASATYTYDKGRLATKTYGNGDTVSYAYDLESRLTNLAIRAGSHTLKQFAYTYDAMGMMRSAVSGNQTIDYGYDAVYQLTSEVVNGNGSITTSTWSYDAAGNLKTATDAFGPAEATVNADNELTQWSRSPNRMTVTGQVAPGIASNKWYASTATARGKSAPVSATDGSFAILGLPLTTGTGNSALTVTVTDVSGNISTQIVNYTQLPPPTQTFGYDQNGNLASVTNGTTMMDYSYDAENRLVRVTSNSVTILECWYDGAGHRIAKREIVGGQTNTWQYIWDGWNLTAVLGGDVKLKEFYTRGVGIAGDIGTLVAVRHWTNVISGPLYYLHNNHRGDVILARQGSTTVATLDYTPYGETRSQSGSYTPRFRFSSKEYDAASGFYHFPYRYYAPQWARWITRDPFGGREIAISTATLAIALSVG